MHWVLHNRNNVQCFPQTLVLIRFIIFGQLTRHYMTRFLARCHQYSQYRLLYYRWADFFCRSDDTLSPKTSINIRSRVSGTLTKPILYAIKLLRTMSFC
ncbi:hypothetical protein PsorP6_004981 [Peronosclerospora sorghi]|uniref:Uncharacterized protein n=1 Tax=Peronosclerospora sorghi TaxID=230839 RepID=A0ACC0W5R1_9STRA|nr:hypothetical protein PsorP6_004981 [Peronosclerospora sorghi]